MKDDALEMALLLDFYGEVLTEKQFEFFDLYHNQDLSLGEIAENEGITRQGVRDVIQRATATLRELEDKLGLIALHERLTPALTRIGAAADAILNANLEHFNHDVAFHAESILKQIEALKQYQEQD